ncbi:hypothetical protein LXL04_007519 [Taraxacum kok-saghyz]
MICGIEGFLIVKFPTEADGKTGLQSEFLKLGSNKNLPHDAYKLLAVPSPIGGVVMSRSSFSVELDAANAAWLSNDVAMLSTKSGELLLLTLVHDGRIVQKLDLSKSKASGITTVGSSFFFLGSRLGDSLLVQFHCGAGAKEEVGDIEGIDVPLTKRLRRSSSDTLQDLASDLNNAHSAQVSKGKMVILFRSDGLLTLEKKQHFCIQHSNKTFSFTVRDSLINVGPLKDFSYGLRMNADPNATGVAKQSVLFWPWKKRSPICASTIHPSRNYHPEAIPGCKGLWTVYHKNSRNQPEHLKTASEDDEYHAYLIISLKSQTMVLQTVSNLEEVTENVDYFLCDGSIIAFTVLHNMYCNHGFIYVTSQGTLKICQLQSLLSYDNYWPVQKIPLKATPHQVTYFAEKNLYPLIVSVPHDNLNIDGNDTVEEFEVRILGPESSGGPWQTKGTIRMQSSENALTVRVVTLSNTTTRENETLMAIGTAYVQGEDVAARGRVLLFSVENSTDTSQATVTEVYSKEMKGAISALASVQGYLLVASGLKVILHKWTGTDLSGVAFFDAPPLYVVSLNIVKNFILLGDIHKSIYFLSWKEQGSQLTLLPKKLLSRVEFHVGAHVTKFLRLQMLPTSTADKTNRFTLVFGTLDGGVGCVAPLDELTFRRLQSLQKKLVDAVPHVAGLMPRSFRQFHLYGKAHRPGPDTIVDYELFYDMLPFEHQLEIANQIGTTFAQIVFSLNDLALGTSFL